MTSEQEQNLKLQQYYDKFQKAVFHTALGILKNASAAEDAMQEVFLKLIIIKRNENAISNIGAWLVTCTKNYCYNYLRNNKKVVGDEYFPSETSNPEAIIQQTIFFSDVLSKLETDERELFMLHVVGGLKHREIADILSLPQSTIRWKYANAVKKLKTILKDY